MYFKSSLWSLSLAFNFQHLIRFELDMHNRKVISLNGSPIFHQQA